MTLGTRVVGGAVLAARSAVQVEHGVVEDLAGHLLQKQTTSDPSELGWSRDRVEEWMTATIGSLLLD